MVPWGRTVEVSRVCAPFLIHGPREWNLLINMNDLLISGEIPWFSMKKIRVETHLWLTPKWFWNNLDRSHSTQEGMNKIWYTVDVYCWLGMKDLTVVRWIHYLNQRVITGIVTCLIHLKPQLIGTYRKIYGIIADLRSADHDTVRILASLPSHPHRWRFVIYLVPPNTKVLWYTHTYIYTIYVYIISIYILHTLMIE